MNYGDLMGKDLAFLARLVLFLKGEGFNSVQIKHICVNILKINYKKYGNNIYRKIELYAKNSEIADAERRFKADNMPKRLQLAGLLEELKNYKK